MESRSERFYSELSHLAAAGANVIQVVSYEWERVIGMARALARDLNLPLYRWSYAQAMQRWQPEQERWEAASDGTDPVGMLSEWHERKDAGLLLLEDFHPYLQPEHHQVLAWLRRLCRLPAHPRRITLVSTPYPVVVQDLEREVPVLELPLPEREDLDAVCRRVWAKEPPAEELLQAAQGLTVMEAQIAFGKALAQRGKLDVGAVPLVAQEKKAVIRQSRVLDYHDPQDDLRDVGGLDLLKDWLKKRGRAFGAGAREFGLEAPRGVLLLGVQGCGKSLMAKTVAANWSFPLLRFDLGRVFGGIVGESEANIRRALLVAEALAPCVLWIDEIEKGLAGMGSSDRSDGGTTARVVGTLLTWLQEKQNPVFVVATANRIDLLPPELLRKGRFDEIFFVDLPGPSARGEIFAIHLKKRGRDPREFDLEQLVRASRSFSGAEIEESVREALYSAYDEGKAVHTRHLLGALKAIFALSRTMREEIVNLRKWASARARATTTHEPEDLPAVEGSETPILRQEQRNPFVPREKN